jgi:TM2 domain-containing membrane protein YozV
MAGLRPRSAVPVRLPGETIDSTAQRREVVMMPETSPKKILPAFLPCLFFGVLGIHRFYVGKVGTGVAQFLTLGGVGVWALINLIMLIVGSFRDNDGRLLTEWT